MAPDQVTRCPHCQAAFRVTPDQLAQAQGWLRCGQCREVFDSTGLVVPWLPEVQASGRVDLKDLLQTQDQGEGSPSSPSVDASDALRSFEQALATFPGRSVIDAPAGPLSELAVPAPVEKVSADVAKPGRGARAWRFLLIVLLVLQLAWLGRVWWWQMPWVAAFFQTGCVAAGCEVPAWRAPDQLRIDHSRFVAADGGYRLEWALHNRSVWPTRMPSMELVLLDEGDVVQVRRVLAPADTSAPDTLAPGQLWDGALWLTLETEMTVSGYRLRVFYP